MSLVGELHNATFHPAMATRKKIARKISKLGVDAPLTFSKASYQRDALDNKTRNILVMGNSGVGKSNLINHLVDRDVCIVEDSPYCVTTSIMFVECKSPRDVKVAELMHQNTALLPDLWNIVKSTLFSDFCFVDTMGMDFLEPDDEPNLLMEKIQERVSDKNIVLHEVWLLVKFGDPEFSEEILERCKKIVAHLRTNNVASCFKIVVTKASFETNHDFKKEVRAECRVFIDNIGIRQADWCFHDLNDFSTTRRTKTTAISSKMKRWLNDPSCGQCESHNWERALASIQTIYRQSWVDPDPPVSRSVSVQQ